MEKHFLSATFQCLLSLLFVFASGQNIRGFISIDCGASDEYSDETTGIFYTTDLNHLNTDRGKSRPISPQYQTEDLARQYWNLRSFPEGTKNCYTLKPIAEGKNQTYLIRTGFVYGDYDSPKNEFPEFDLYLGAEKWATVKVEDPEKVITFEIIQTIQFDYTYVCLVRTGSSVPFISVLEMRLLSSDNTAYFTPFGSLELSSRLDLGSDKIVRYKDDALDRIWAPFKNKTAWNVLSTLNQVDPGNTFNPPSLVMSTAVTPKKVNDPLEIDWTPKNVGIGLYLCLHFLEIEELSQNQTRELTIHVNDILLFGPFVPSYLVAMTIYSTKIINMTSLHIRVSKTENSTLPAILNGFEIFTVKPMVRILTDQVDVDAILKIKSVYESLGLNSLNERDWQGDPCLPSEFMWDGLNCSLFNNFDPPRIVSLNLSSSGLTGVITPNIADLTMLRILDLSNNSLRGPVPDFLSFMPLLRVLNLENNNFSGSLPIGLQEKINKRSILFRADGNPYLCVTDPCNITNDATSKTEKKKKPKNIFIPVVVSSVAGFTVILLSSVALIMWCIQRKKQAMVNLGPSGAPNEELEFRKHSFKYSQIVTMTNNFEQVIGEGGFGKVYLGLFNESQVAVKMLSRLSDHGSNQFKIEARILTRVHHRNLTALVGYCDEAPHTGLVYEYMSNGDLEWHISEKNPHPLSWEERLNIAIDTAQGLEYLHSGCKPPIIHRDVKITNILLNEKLEAKVADFGLSRAFSFEDGSHVTTIVAGTPGYLDPQYYVTNRLTEKSDVFSFGVVLLEIITGRTVIVSDGNGISKHITDWVKVLIPNADVASIVDPALPDKDFDNDSVWKAIELAMACVSRTSIKRPIMSHVVIELKECLSMETGRVNKTVGDTVQSRESFSVMPLNTDMTPYPR